MEKALPVRPGTYIRKHRGAAGLTLRQLAGDLGVSHVFLGSMERCVRPVPDKYVDRLAVLVPGINARRLRELMEETARVTIEFSPRGALERSLATAFSRKAERGFSDAELATLKALLMEDLDADS